MNLKRNIIFIKVLILVVVITVFALWQNNDIVVTNYQYNNSSIPKTFEDYKILHISDLHNKSFGKNQRRLIKHINSINPDIIVITGDLIDSRKTNIGLSLNFIRQAINIVPIYYVTGNHEYRLIKYPELKNKLIELGVIILDNKNFEIINGEDKFNIIGVQDFSFFNSKTEMINVINELTIDSEFNLLLSHRPELFEVYSETDVDLVLTGHAHGGQIRLPVLGGLVAPNQGLFPDYTKGIHSKEATSMVVSRGLGNSIIPFRVFNRPELVVISLSSNID